MVHRSQKLQEFLTATQEAITARTGTDTPAATAMQRISASINVSASASDFTKPRTLPACAYLDPAIAGAMHGPTDIARVASAINGLAPELYWRFKASDDPVFANGHANADILGSVPEALERRDDVEFFTIPEALRTRCVHVVSHSWRSGVYRLTEAIGVSFAISKMTVARALTQR